MSVDWRESDGPVVAPLTHRGFGTRLLSRALSQFGGTIKSKFEPTGLICEMSLMLPEGPDPLPNVGTHGDPPEVFVTGSRRMAAGNAIGGHRTLNKTDSPFAVKRGI